MENSIYLKSVPLVLEDHCSSLLKALHNQQKKSQLCDVELVVGNERFSAHKAVLAAYSSYFQALFDRGTQADDAGSKVCNVTTIHLSSITINTFIPILHFLYTSRLHLFSENIGEIIRTARKLQISTIVKACERLLDQNITLPSIISAQSEARNNSLASDSTQSVLYVDLKSEDDEERVTSSEQPPNSINYSLINEEVDEKVASFVNSDLNLGSNIKSHRNRTPKRRNYQKSISSMISPPSTINSVQLRNISSISAPLYGSSGMIGQLQQPIINQSSPMLSGMVTSEAEVTGIMASAAKLPTMISSGTKLSVDPSLNFENNLATLGNIFGADNDFVLEQTPPENASSAQCCKPSISLSVSSSKINDPLQLQNTVMANSFTRMPPNSTMYSQTVGNTSVYTCKECFKYFTNISDALYHYYSEHQDTSNLKTKGISPTVSSSNPINHNCPHCGRVFNNKNNLKRHILIKHRTDHRFKCSTCGRKYAIRQSLQYHMRTMHNMELVEEKSESKTRSKKSNKASLPIHQTDIQPVTFSHSTVSLPSNDSYTQVTSSGENVQITGYMKYNAPNTPNSYLNTQPVNIPRTTEMEKGEINLEPIEDDNLPTIHNIKSIRAMDMQGIDNNKDGSAMFSGHVKAEPQFVAASSLAKKSEMYTGNPFLLSSHNASLPVILSSMSEEVDKKTENLNSNISKLNPQMRCPRCESCHRNFSTLQSFSRHKRSCNKHKCPNCHRGFSQGKCYELDLRQNIHKRVPEKIANMRRHFKIFHCEQKPYQCKVCSKAYGLQQSFRYHMRDKHGIDIVSKTANQNKTIP